jgi:hypothetical protein
LCGDVPDGVDWMQLLRLANHALTATSLIDLVACGNRKVPDDVSARERSTGTTLIATNDLPDNSPNCATRSIGLRPTKERGERAGTADHDMRPFSMNVRMVEIRLGDACSLSRSAS